MSERKKRSKWGCWREEGERREEKRGKGEE
jgi:hypothetical protein